ncbi:uncharacterized protein IUM83_03182 [Phytophthora cinnamomi]|uniref:uncharacterized protein n=1 Tax=Phytophthora cinnamomi TaxID=4785 RepID=UPI003559CF6A|nr:hypothetical protein IUM83_03182 [Phytophthora cinnamomi]
MLSRPGRVRSRNELLQMEEISPDAFFRSVKYFGPNGSLRAGAKLEPIAMVLKTNEPRGVFEMASSDG